MIALSEHVQGEAASDSQPLVPSLQALFDTADFALLRRGYLLTTVYTSTTTTVELTPFWDQLAGEPLLEMPEQSR